MPKWSLGTMGFSYQDWKPNFYPDGTNSKGFLSYYSQIFNSVELDTTFHAIPKPATVKEWGNSVPEGFYFCAKLPKKITHERRLAGIQGDLDEFIDTMRILEDKLGVLLIQLPPGFTFGHRQILENFLVLLPSEVRFAVEFRHVSWFNPETAAMLHSRNICWATTEYPRLPNRIVRTSDFLYIRWIGQHGSYPDHSYERVDNTDQLTWWKKQIENIAHEETDVYGFFNNDYAGYAAGTCIKFREIVGLPIVEKKLEQGRLF
jgi:uncharacterized protein YecE (DUF72 family)